MKNNQLKNIENIIKCIDAISNYCKDCCSLEEFQANTMLVDACVFNLSQIGELVTKISDDTKNLFHEIPWKAISGMRNKIVHDYFSVNMNIVWDTINNDLPELRNNLDKIMSTLIDS